MKRSVSALALAITFATFGFSGLVIAADSTEDAYDSFQQTAMQIEQQLDAKQVELDSLMADKQGTSPRVLELFKEMGELRGQLFIARAELDNAIEASENSSNPGAGRFYRGGPGFGCCGGGFVGRGFGRGYRYRHR